MFWFNCCFLLFSFKLLIKTAFYRLISYSTYLQNYSMLLWTPWLADNILSNLKHYITYWIYHGYIKHTKKWYNPFRPGGVCLSNLHRERDGISLKGVPNLHHSADLKQTVSSQSKQAFTGLCSRTELPISCLSVTAPTWRSLVSGLFKHSVLM